MRILSLILSLVFILSAECAIALDRLDISVGSSVRPTMTNDHPNTFFTSMSWDTDWHQKTTNNYQRTIRLEAGIGLLSGDSSQIKTIHLAPTVHYQMNAVNPNFFIEASVGVTHISSAHWKPKHYMGSHVMFADRLAIGFSSHHNEISLNFFHISNAGLTTPNPGADIIYLRTSFAL